MKTLIKVMLIEDHAGYREVITRALKKEQTLDLISQFGTAEIALRELQTASEPNRPDLVLLDLNLPGMGGIEALPWIKKYSPDTEVIILTQSDKAEDVLAAITQGASGYLLKSATVPQIKEGIQTVMNGGASLDPDVARYILNTLKARPAAQAKAEKTLSERELEILTLLGDGLVKKEISTELSISVTTVAYHVKHIYEKLGVQNAPAAVSKAYRSGILS